MSALITVCSFRLIADLAPDILFAIDLAGSKHTIRMAIQTIEVSFADKVSIRCALTSVSFRVPSIAY